MCQGPINQAKLPLTHTGRRYATPQAEAVHGKARDHSLTRTGIMPTARTRQENTRQTFTKTHASYLTEDDDGPWMDVFPFEAVMSEGNVMELVGLWTRKRPERIFIDYNYPKATIYL